MKKELNGQKSLRHIRRRVLSLVLSAALVVTMLPADISRASTAADSAAVLSKEAAKGVETTKASSNTKETVNTDSIKAENSAVEVESNTTKTEETAAETAAISGNEVSGAAVVTDGKPGTAKKAAEGVPAGYGEETGAVNDNLTYYFYSNGSSDQPQTFAPGTMYITGTGTVPRSTAWTDGEKWSNDYEGKVKTLVIETSGNAFASGALPTYTGIQGLVLKSGVTGLGSGARFHQVPTLTHVEIPTDTMDEINITNMNLTDIALRGTRNDEFWVTLNSTYYYANHINFYVENPGNAESEEAKGIKKEYDAKPGTYTLKSLTAYDAMKTADLTVSLDDQAYIGEKIPYKVTANTTGVNAEALQVYIVAGTTALNTNIQVDENKNPLTMPAALGDYQFFVAAPGSDTTFRTSSNMVSFTVASPIEYELQDDDTKLIIKPVSGKTTAAMPDYENNTGSAGAPWRADYASKITSVEIKSGISNIGAYAFSGLSLLKEITLEDSSTEWKIGQGAFRQCSALTDDAVSKILGKTAEVGNQAFYQCTALTNVTIPANVKTLIGATFYGCTGLQSVTVADKDTVWTGTSSSPFSGCSALKTVSLPDGYTEIPAYFLSGNTSIESFTIPSTVKTIGQQAFYNCSALDLQLPEGLEKLAYNALDGTAITKLTIPENTELTGSSSNTLEVTKWASLTELTINGNVNVVAFKTTSNQSKSLQKVTFGSKVETIPDSAYSNITTLTEVTFPTEGNSALKKIGDSAFSRSAIAGDIVLPSTVTYVGTNAFGNTALTTVTMEAPAEVGAEDYYTIGAGAFGNIDTISRIELRSPAILRFNGTGSQGITSRTKNKTSDMPNVVVKIYAADLQGPDGGDYSGNIVYSSWANVNYDTAIFTQEAAYRKQLAVFSGSSSGQRPLVKLELEGGVTEEGFKYTVKKTGEEKENWTVTITGYTGEDTEVTIPGTIEVNYGETGVGSEEKINHKVTAIGTTAFAGSNITKITLPDTVETIKDSAFLNCNSLTTINLEKVKYIEDKAFTGTSVKNLSFDSLITIGEDAFSTGNIQSDIILPDTVTSIGKGAFRGVFPKEGETYSKVRIPENDSYTKIENSTFDRVVARKITIPANITEIGSYVFGSDKVLSLEILGKNVTSVAPKLCSYVIISDKDCTSYKTFEEAGYTIVGGKDEAKAELESQIKAAEDALEAIVRSDYQESYLEELEAKIEAVKAVAESADVDLEDYLEAAKDLAKLTTSNFRKTDTKEAEKSLSDLLSSIKSNYKSGDYTAESWNNLSKVMDKVNAYLESGDCVNSELENLSKELQAAVKALEKKPSSPTPGTGTGTVTPGTGTPGTGTPGIGTPGTQDPQKVTVKKVTLKKVTSPKKKTLKVTWKKVSGATGYQIQIGTNKKMTKNKKVINIKKGKTVTKTIKKLKSKKKYYVKVRAYKTVNGKKYYGAWSKPKNVKVK